MKHVHLFTLAFHGAFVVVISALGQNRPDPPGPTDNPRNRPLSDVIPASVAPDPFAAVPHPGEDWPMFGGRPTRNAIGSGRNPPRRWEVKQVRDGLGPGLNIKWMSQTGVGFAAAAPVVSDGFIWVGTNNENPRDPTRKEPAPVLMCFRESDGAFVWQYVAPVREGLRRDYSFTGIKCSPWIERERLWFTTPGAEVICLDLAPLLRGAGMPKLSWKLDMREELGVFVHPFVMGWPGANSIALYDRWIYVNTDNGVDWTHLNVPAPLAPSLVCLEKDTGKVVWKDNSPGTNLLHIQWSSPLALELDGTACVIAGFGDGKLRSFNAATGERLWQLDCNPPEYRRKKYPAADGPSEILASPVFHDGRVYVAIGQEPEHGEGAGNLVCVDAKTGSLVWQNSTIHRSLSSVVVEKDRLYAMDLSGFVYGLDRLSGNAQWRLDVHAHIWSSPLWVDGLLYVGDEDGDATVIDLAGMEERVGAGTTPLHFSKRDFLQQSAGDSSNSSAKTSLVWVNQMQAPLLAPPVYVNGTLYWNVGGYLCAIESSTQAAGPVSARTETNRPDAVYVPTPHDVVERMLELAKVTERDRVVDLGSGDGRVVIAAARKYGSRAVGYELDPVLVQRSLAAVREQKVENLVRIEKRDLFSADLADVDVVVVFLPGSLLERLVPSFRQLKPGARIVSHDFVIPGVVPEETVRLISSDDNAEHAIHLWKAPLKVP